VLTLTPGSTVTGVSFAYQYVTGYHGTVGANFTLEVAGSAVYSSPMLNKYPFAKPSVYSPAVVVAAPANVAVPASGGDVTFKFDNVDKNLQIALPMQFNVTCAGTKPCFAAPAPPAPTPPAPPPTPPAPPNPVTPTQVYTAGEGGHNCYRIPNLLPLPSGTLLAFAEGRTHAKGCKPDVGSNRPIVVRASKDSGKTWGNVTIAGPALAKVGTNYPGAFMRGNDTVVLRYILSNKSTFETLSKDEGATWSTPVEASQPPGGVKCGSFWPKMVGTDVIMPCQAWQGDTARSSDGGLTWKLSTQPINFVGTDVTGLGEMMVIADGRTATSVSMSIRAGSTNGKYMHAIAHSADAGDTWGNASAVFVNGPSCQGSIGRDSTAAPGHVMLAAPAGTGAYLGRGNMVVYTLDESVPGADVAKKVSVWPQAAGYSDFAQVAGGPLLLLFEAGGGVYDEGIKISPV